MHTKNLTELKRIVSQIPQPWPRVRVVIRGDSGFCREEIMARSEGHQVDYSRYNLQQI